MKVDKEILKKERDGIVDLIEKLRAPYNARLEEIDNLLWEEKLKEAQNNIGKCFVYRNNCYSLPKTQKDYWNNYYKVAGFKKAVNEDDYDRYIVTECYKDSYGNICIKQEHDCISSPRFEDYEEISSKEFNEVYRKLLAELEGK